MKNLASLKREVIIAFALVTCQHVHLGYCACEAALFRGKLGDWVAKTREVHVIDDLTGGCLCGAVRYRCSGEPDSMGLCQCERCQRQSGSSFLIAIVYSRESVTFESGELGVYTAADDSGSNLSRHFCLSCGSAVMITLDRYPEIRSMMGGTVDDKSRIRPTFSLWCSSAQPWLELPRDIQQFPDYPDGLIA
jgi:hypothetical protein